jgi:hypothetical protein
MQDTHTRRDSLGRTFHTPTQDLQDASLHGDRSTIRSAFMRRDERKGAELLNDRKFGKGRESGQAPLDESRMKHGTALKATERIFPLAELDQKTRTDLVSLFQNPAVVRAFVTNPDKTIQTITSTLPHLRAPLEKHAPFSHKGDHLEINIGSKMYTTIQREIASGIPSAELSRVSALKYSLDHLLAAGFGRAAGSEMASYKLLRSFAEGGPLTTATLRAAQRLDSAMDSQRARSDLAIVRGISQHAPGVELVASNPVQALQPSTEPQSTPLQGEPAVVQPSSPQTTIQPRAEVLAPTVPALEASPSLRIEPPVPPVPEIRPTSPPAQGVTSQPTLATEPTSRGDTPATPTLIAPLPPAFSPELKSSTTTQVSVEAAPPAPTTSVELTPTMKRLVEVVNNSTLDRQIGSPRNNPILEFSDRDHDILKAMLTDPATKRELLGYSDAQLKAGFEAVRPERIKYLEEWLAMNHRNAINHPGFARSMAGITPTDTNRIGQVVGIAREVAREKSALPVHE